MADEEDDERGEATVEVVEPPLYAPVAVEMVAEEEALLFLHRVLQAEVRRWGWTGQFAKKAFTAITHPAKTLTYQWSTHALSS